MVYLITKSNSYSEKLSKPFFKNFNKCIGRVRGDKDIVNIDIFYIAQNDIFFFCISLKLLLIGRISEVLSPSDTGDRKKLLVKIIDQGINIFVDICSLLINQSSVGIAPLG